MIALKQRFHGQNGIRIVYRHGQTVHGEGASLKYIADNKQDSYRCSVIVSKKVHKSAVVRNRIRRRVYEHIRVTGPEIIGHPDLVITIFEVGFSTISYPELQKNISDLLKKANLLRN